MEKQVVEHTSQPSVQLAKTSKGDITWEIKSYKWDAMEAAQEAVEVFAYLESKHGKQEEPKEKKDDLHPPIQQA